MGARTLLGLVALAASLFAPQVAAAATFTVNTTGSGYTAEGVLTSGNIQVRP